MCARCRTLLTLLRRVAASRSKRYDVARSDAEQGTPDCKPAYIVRTVRVQVVTQLCARPRSACYPRRARRRPRARRLILRGDEAADSRTAHRSGWHVGCRRRRCAMPQCARERAALKVASSWSPSPRHCSRTCRFRMPRQLIPLGSDSVHTGCWHYK